ncbi:MAG TPA: glycosyl transferase, partial [Bacteroidetes bacterium]|nr:glycosyl transferase [Bacteroidota bacterium]
MAVIIAARNEEKNILNVLRDVLSQDYPSDKMEVIVVDDFSSDKTAERTKEISDSRVKLIQMKNEMSNEKYSSKKKSIETAVAKTNAELIVTTDADCRMNSNWLKSLVACYELKGKQFIMGAVKFHGEKNLFERMQSLDFLGYMGIACGSLFWRMPALCNGA